MSITHTTSKKKDKDRALSKKALSKGGKITEIPEGETTEASHMKYRYRKTKKDIKKPPVE
jgi:hypothetical protein